MADDEENSRYRDVPSRLVASGLNGRRSSGYDQFVPTAHETPARKNRKRKSKQSEIVNEGKRKKPEHAAQVPVKLRNQDSFMSNTALHAQDCFRHIAFEVIEEMEKSAHIELYSPAYTNHYLFNAIDTDKLRKFLKKIYEDDQLVQNAIEELMRDPSNGPVPTICFLELLKSVDSSELFVSPQKFASFVDWERVYIIAAVLLAPQSPELEQLWKEISCTDEVKMWQTTARTVLQYLKQQLDPEFKKMDPLITFRLYQVHLSLSQGPLIHLLPLRKQLVYQALCSHEPMLANSFVSYFADQNSEWTNEFIPLGYPVDKNFVLALLASIIPMVSACQYVLLGATSHTYKQWNSSSSQRFVICPITLVKDSWLKLQNEQLRGNEQQVKQFSRYMLDALPHVGHSDILIKIALFATYITCHVLSEDMSAKGHSDAIDTCFDQPLFKQYGFNDKDRTALKNMLLQSFNPD